MKYMKNKYGDENGNIVSFWSTDDNVLCEDGKTLRENLDVVNSQFKDIANLKNSTNVVDLKKYNITQADYEYPFTTENYKVAYQNGVGFQHAIDDAKANNIQELIIPPGNYPLCYATNNYETVNSILTSVGVDLKGYGSKLYVIYDELDTGLNPYYTGDLSKAHAMCGVVLRTDSNVEGIEFVGERAYRTTENAKYREGSYGIQLTKWSNGNKIKNCKTHHFSGDGIGAGIIMEQVATWFESDAVATAITWNDSEWVESTTSYTTSYHTVGDFDLTKPFQCRGSLYFIWTTAPLKFHCFDKEENYIGTVRVNQGEPFYFFKNTYRYYLEVTSSAPHKTTDTSSVGIALGYSFFYNTTIEGCESYLNTRGGISNLPSGSTIKNCKIYNNGCKFGNMVAFYDNTQFGIDIEDWYIHNITIDNCLIFGNLHGLLYRCHDITIKNSTIYGMTKSLNYCVNFYANNTTFKSACIMETPTTFGKKVAVGCTFDGEVAPEINILDNVNIPISATIDNTTGIISFLGDNGKSLFQLDLSEALKITPSLYTDNLLINYDFSGNIDGNTPTDTGSSLSTFRLDKGNYVEKGLIVNTAYAFAGCITEVNDLNLTEEITISVVAFGGCPIHFTDYIHSSINAGVNLPLNNVTTTLSPFNFKLNYINTNGESVESNFTTPGGEKAYTSTMEEKLINMVNFPNFPKTYMVLDFVFNSNGIQIYINSAPFVNVFKPDDFVKWDFSTITKFNLWDGVVNNAQILKEFRVYNIGLDSSKIKQNYKFVQNNISE